MPRKRREIPWLDQRDNGVYYVYWFDGKQTRRKSLDTREPLEASRRYGEFLVTGPAEPERNAVLTVEQALDDYLREHCEAVDDKGRPNVVDITRQRYAAAHLKAWFGKADILSIGPAESRAYIAARREGLVGGGRTRRAKAGTDGTIRRELVCLVAAHNHAIKWGRIKDVSRVELPAGEPRGGIEWFTKEQIDLLIEETTGPVHDFIAIAYYTGARRRSVENLTRFQVDLAHGTMNLMTPGARITRKRKPIVPIFPEIRPIIERRMEGGGTYLFGDNRDMYRRFVEAAQCILQVSECRPHMLRHSRATHLLMAGEDIYKVARLLGDTVATVERVYGHYTPEYLITGGANA